MTVRRPAAAPAAAAASSRAWWASLAAWAVLLCVYVAAFLHGSEFASTKRDATFFGCAIGASAFFAYLAVEAEEDEGDGDAEDSDSDGETEPKPKAE